MTDQPKCIDEFVKFTCSTETEARSYLENAGWNIEAALLSYFDDRDDRVDPSTLGRDAVEDIPDRESENESMHADDDEYADVEPPPSFSFDSSPEKKPKSESKSYKPASNIATLSSLRRAQDEEEEDDDQLYYAGGSMHSGQQIMGNDRRGDVAGEVFKSLKHMVRVGEVEVAGPSRESKKRFGGVGYRLGQTPDDTQVVGKPPGDEDARPELNLRLYRDGFTIGDNPLRPYSDPENREAIEMLLRGEVPMHLVPPGTKGGKVNVKVEDYRLERYSGPTNRAHVFSGSGHVLGNVVPQIVKNDDPKPQVEEKSDEPPPKSPVEVNDNEPTTSIAVRLPSGVRTQVRLNLTHTVNDLRRHLVTVERGLQSTDFAFMVSFPPKEVSDENLSVVDAGLVNSSVHLRVKK